MKQKAKEYINRGWSVIPVAGKIPITEWKEYQGRIVNTDTIDLWWDKNPEANVGIVTGKISELTVIDIDGEKGEESLKTIFLPPTYTVKTPQGWHLYFKYDSSYPQGVGILPGIDIRNDGGYVVAPYSKINGIEYTIANDCELETLPKFETIFKGKIKAQTNSEKSPQWVEELLKNGASEGQRNQSLAKLAGHYRTKNIGATETFEILTHFAKRCIPEMDLNEVWNTIQSIYRYAGNIAAAKITEAPEINERGDSLVY